MVVDPLGWINHTLTEEEKTTMMKEGRCFRCGNKGHMSKACPTCPSPSSTSNTSKSKPQYARTTKVEEVEEEDDEEPETKLGVDHIINSIVMIQRLLYAKEVTFKGKDGSTSVF